VSFVRTRTIKNQKYRYLETRWREGGKVRSKSVYLGAGAIYDTGPIADHGRGQFGLETLEEAAKASVPSAPAPSAGVSSAEPEPQAAQSPSDAEATAS
jgi:hypothetical protein